MNLIKNYYDKVSVLINEEVSFSKDWRWLLISCVAVFAVSVAFRASFASRWAHDLLWVFGERVMSTHDAYYWLAKAKGFGVASGYPLAWATKQLHDITGLGLGTIAFWSPAIMGAQVSVTCCLWGWLLGGRFAGLFAGMVGSLTPGFFYRTRLGYFDTDMFTLLMPMIVGLGLIYWAKGFIGNSLSELHRPIVKRTMFKSSLIAFCVGVIARFAGCWHHDIVNFSILLFWAVFVGAVLFVKKDYKPSCLWELMIFLFAAFPGTPASGAALWPFSSVGEDLWTLVNSGVGICVAGVLIYIGTVLNRKGYLQKEKWIYILAFCIFCAFITNILDSPFVTVVNKLASYVRQPDTASTAEAAVAGPIFPSIIQSIVEAKQMPFVVILERNFFWSWLGWVALIATGLVLVFRPLSLILFPLVLLSLLSYKLGVRFSMFGGAALAVYLSVALKWLFDVLLGDNPRKRVVMILCQVGLSIILLISIYGQYAKLPLTPVITKAHAEALAELETLSPKGSRVWTWWDWGYATQYYSLRDTVADGGLHDGRTVYPLAYVMTTQSPANASRMIRFSAQYPIANKLQSGLAPASIWSSVERSEIMSILAENLSKSDYPKVPNQYVVISWKDISLAKWISHFGNWDLGTGTTEQARVRTFAPGKLGFNIQQGAVMNRQGGGGLVSDITVLDEDGVESKEYYMNKLSPRLLPKTRHLLINKVTRQSILLDRMAYHSMMTRLLTGDPNDPEISQYFRLVIDKLPFARVYEVVQ